MVVRDKRRVDPTGRPKDEPAGGRLTGEPEALAPEEAPGEVPPDQVAQSQQAEEVLAEAAVDGVVIPKAGTQEAEEGSPAGDGTTAVEEAAVPLGAELEA